MAQSSTCTHIKVNGLRCGCPSLRGEQFCYFHQRMHRGVRMPAQARLHPIALIEDEESIQAALMEVINALMRNTIDLKRATLILRALHIAVKNAARVKFGLEKTNMVRDIPQYEDVGADAFVRPGGAAAVNAAEPGKHHVGTAATGCPSGPEVSVRSLADAPTELDLPAVSATEPKPVHPDPEFWERWEAGGVELKRQEAARQAAALKAAEAAKDHVATAAIGCPATLTLSNAKGKGSAAPNAAPALPKHDFKPQPESAGRTTQRAAASPTAPKREVPPNPPRKTEAQPNPPRKPAASAQAPKERKNAAQRASAG